MEFERRVRIRVHTSPQEGPDFGSGYLLAPRLVLTAAHLVSDTSGLKGGTVTVSPPDRRDQEYTGSVIWRRIDDVIDAALIEVDEGGGWDPSSFETLRIRPPQRWGYLIGTRPYPVSVAGFPRMQKEATGRRLDEQLTGEIDPGDGGLAGLYEISSSEPFIPVAPSAGRKVTPWSGISGAAVICEDPNGGDLLCGVVRQDRQATKGTRLTATRASELLTDEKFCDLVTEHTGWVPHLEPAEATGLLASTSRERDLRSPAMLLRADVEAVPFYGREEEQRELLEWCLQETDTFSLQVLTGPGGQGKTRLARHLTGILRNMGWVAGHLHSHLPDSPAQFPDLSSLKTAYPLLLVIDYAEERPYWVRTLIEHLRVTRHRTRMLLVARFDGAWRTDNLSATAGAREILRTAPVVELSPLNSREELTHTRAAAFARAAENLASLLESNLSDRLGRPDGGWPAIAARVQPPQDLEHVRYDSALTLQMTALTDLLQRGSVPVCVTPGEPVEAALLAHEQRYWENTAATPAFQLGDVRTTTLRHAVAVSVLCGAESQAEAEATIQEIHGVTSQEAVKIAEWLHALYPPENNQYWGSFQPDRVAEYLATATIDSATLDNLLKRASGEQEKRIITVLTRATLAHEKSRRSDMSKRGQRDLTAALNGPRRLHMETHLAVTKELSSPTEDVRGASDIAVRLLESGLKAFTDDGNQSYLIDPAAALGSYANRLFLLSYWLDVAGQPEKALTEGRRALEKYRVLTEENDSPRRFLLGVVLNRVGRLAVKAGEMGEALSLNLEALAIFRSLPGEDSSVLGLSVATSLREVGLHLSQSRRHDEGLNAGSEALATFSELEQENPNHSRDVMRSLAALSLMWYARGGLRRALKFAGESTQEYYKVPPSERASLNEYMSTVLGMKVMMLDEVGCTKEAEETRSEIAEIADFD